MTWGKGRVPCSSLNILGYLKKGVTWGDPGQVLRVTALKRIVKYSQPHSVLVIDHTESK